jgi:hypothetical protein
VGSAAFPEGDWGTPLPQPADIIPIKKAVEYSNMIPEFLLLLAPSI